MSIRLRDIGRASKKSGTSGTQYTLLRKALKSVGVNRNPYKLAKDVRVMKKVIKDETRYNPIPLAANTALQAGYFTICNGMVIGDTDGTRQGTKICMKNIRFTLQCYSLAAATTNSASNVRVMLVLDKQANGATFVAGDLLENGGVAGNNWCSPLSFVNRHRFNIYYDKTFCVHPISNTRQAVGATSYDAPGRILKIRKTWKEGKTVGYNTGNAGTIADITTNGLQLVVFAESVGQVAFSGRGMIQYTP